MTEEHTGAPPEVVPLEAALPPSVPMGIVLSDEQEFAVKSCVAYLADKIQYKTKRVFSLGGFAGTGKTTVIKEICNRLWLDGKSPAVCAFTGKAASVLQKKGVEATTIHSLIYRYEGLEKHTKRPIFSLVCREDLPCDSIIIDEGSMISKEIYNDLLKLELPLLFVGDPGQLEPVGDDPNLMKSCDIILSKIHRQAEGSPIIKFSADIRSGRIESYPPGKIATDLSTLSLISRKAQTPAQQSELFLYVDQVIVATNKIRSAFNKQIRMLKGFESVLPKAGEKVICLENNKQYQVFNGQQFKVIDAFDQTYNTIYLELEEEGTGRVISSIPALISVFTGEFDKLTTRYNRQMVCLFDFAYALTGHKSQGSEWDKVYVHETYMPPKIWDMKRWQYTTATRAAKELYYVR